MRQGLKFNAATYRITRAMPSDQVNVEVDDLACLVFCGGIVLILVTTAEVRVAAQLRTGFFDSILDRTSSICRLC
jgi:hypothetical protein